jgi:hypothetical protein
MSGSVKGGAVQLVSGMGCSRVQCLSCRSQWDLQELCAVYMAIFAQYNTRDLQLGTAISQGICLASHRCLASLYLWFVWTGP